ncbi:nucleotide exchange factor GrpE [Paraperlucidibaca wandonensis]|uniref:Protein GrpE n=1 Tax=Paraperlucidibaca wandonensis TaxID=1268273 RepID=A0ABW3HJI2_9GAMM
MSEQTPPEHDDIPEQAVDAQPQAMDIPEFADDSVDFQTARIAELEGQLKDLQLRTQAEVQNIQRRSERDVTAAHKFALEKFAGSLLDVADNLERALQATPSEESALKALHEGVTLTHKLFVDTMKRFGVEAVDPLGEPFNPELHQAVSTQPSTTAEPNSVTAVFQKGYTLSGRLLRPAMVVVASAG